MLLKTNFWWPLQLLSLALKRWLRGPPERCARRCLFFVWGCTKQLLHFTCFRWLLFVRPAWRAPKRAGRPYPSDDDVDRDAEETTTKKPLLLSHRPLGNMVGIRVESCIIDLILNLLWPYQSENQAMITITPGSMFRRRRQQSTRGKGHNIDDATDDEEAPVPRIMKKKRPRPFLRLNRISSLSGRRSSPVDLPDYITRISLLVAALLFLFELWRARSALDIHRPTEDMLDNLQIQFEYSNTDTIRLPKHHIVTRSTNYGGLEFDSTTTDSFSRRINLNDEEIEEVYREQFLESVDEEKFSSKYQPDEDLEDQERPCQRTNWQSKIFPNCNEFHELTLERPSEIGQDYAVRYLGHGYFRDAWLFESHVSEFAYKRLRLNSEFNVDFWDMHKIHKEAIVMERLTPSPRIVDIYGHCSTTILSEPMASEVWRSIVPGTGHAKQSDLDELDDVYPRNNFTVTEKLDMALEMAGK